MKSFLFTLILLIPASLSLGQKNEHLKFKGVPIDGTLNDYLSKMKESGFTLLNSEDGTAVLNGDFAGYKDCIIQVSTLKGKDLVSKISVRFPVITNWSPLSSNYFNLKELLTEKYGEPNLSIEKFDTSSPPDDDVSRMYHTKLNRCKYLTTFELKNGSIQLSIGNGSYSSTYVSLLYFDKVNSEIIRQKAINDL
ncbi:MAG: hypothetical protein NXI00_07700 [Cytophagales bacterium]|nr:hypothetical protein [Cytophagales bacterium]